MVEMELVVSSRLKQLLPALSEEEREQLEANIVADGRVRDPILYWHDGKKNLVVDGMNRLAIAKAKRLPYRTEPMEFKSVEDVELWMLNNALGRRNLMKPQEVRKVRGELYNRMKRDDGGHGDQKSGRQNGVPIQNASQIVAEKSGVSPRTVQRDGQHVADLNKLSDPVKKAVDEGRLKVTDKELHALAKAEPTKQQEVARAVRTGTAKSTAEALAKAGVPVSKPRAPKCEHNWVADGNGERYCEHCKEDHPDNGKAKPAKGREVVHAAKLVDELTRKHVGHVVRGLDAIAKANGGQGPVYKEAFHHIDTFIACIKRMRAGER